MFDIDLPDYDELFVQTGAVDKYEVTFVERHPEEGLLDYDVFNEPCPKIGQKGDWYTVVEVLEIDHEGRTATVVFEFI